MASNLPNVAIIVWGDVSSWVAGVGTFSAVVVALYFSIRQVREQRADKLRSVYAWTEYDQSDGWYLILQNLTNYPIYSWSVDLSWSSSEGINGVDGVDNKMLGLVPPGQQRYSWEPKKVIPAEDSAVRVSITFRDADGVSCVRASDGLLTTKRASSTTRGMGT
jgi:hypothetical protein